MNIQIYTLQLPLINNQSYKTISCVLGGYYLKLYLCSSTQKNDPNRYL